MGVKICKYPILILRVVVTWYLQIFVDVCIAPISLYYHACTKAGFDNMICNNKKHFYDPYDSLDAEWKARLSHEMLSVREAARLSDSAASTLTNSLQTASLTPKRTTMGTMWLLGKSSSDGSRLFQLHQPPLSVMPVTLWKSWCATRAWADAGYLSLRHVILFLHTMLVCIVVSASQPVKKHGNVNL